MALGLGLSASGCGGPNIHKDLQSDPYVMRREWVRPSHQQWKAGERGTAYSNAVQYKHTLIYGNLSEGLSAIYPRSSKLRWNLPIPGGVDSEIAVEGDNGYVGGGDGFLYSVDLRSGRVNWRYDLRQPKVSRPLIKEGRLFVTTADDTVYCIDAGSGEWIWHYKRRTSSTATVHGAATPVLVGRSLYAGLSDGFLVKLSVETGKLSSELRLSDSNKFTDIDADLVYDEGRLYVPTYDGALNVVRERDLTVLWRYEAGGTRQILLAEGKVYFPSSDGAIYALKSDNGKLLWKFELDGGSPTDMVMTDKYLIFGSSYQYLYALDKSSGRGLYRFDVGNKSGFSGAPLYIPASERLKEDRVYVISGAGHLYAFTVTGNAPIQRRFAPERSSYQFIQ